jgi:hypothetical protein
MNEIVKQGSLVIDSRYTQDVIPVLDTSKFEHMQRIATVMAETSTIPDSLRMDKEGAELPQRTVIANCFRIVNQAVRWGMDPFAVADCASIVHGRMMWEGKLIAGVLDAKLGVQLQYDFNEGAGQELGITVSATLPNETKVRTIFGRVKDWHRGAKSPWANEGAWKRQLRYMGAREWARAHKPSVMLGIYTDDEMDSAMSRDVPAGHRAQRIKNITPTKNEVADIPDAPEPPQATAAEPTKDVPEPLADEAGLLAKLEEDREFCTCEADVAELRESNLELIARMTTAGQLKASVILEVE